MNPANTIASDTLVEAIARAIFAAQWEAGPLSDDGPPNFGRGGFKTEVVSWTAAARAALTAITEAGYVVAPRIATEEMLEVGAHCASSVPIPYTAEHIYRAMINAVTHCNNNGKAE